MYKHTVTLKGDLEKKVDYLLRNTEASNLDSLVEILVDYAYSQIKKKGKIQ